MSTFTLAISCLTTSNLPWFVGLPFQGPMQYCSLQHQTLLPSPVTPTTGCCFYFGSVSSFLLELFFYCSPLGTYQPGDLICHCPIFLPFHTVHGVLKARILKRFAVAFSSGPCYVRTLHHNPSVLLVVHGIVHSFIELDKAVFHVIRLVSVLWLWFSVCLPSDG